MFSTSKVRTELLCVFDPTEQLFQRRFCGNQLKVLYEIRTLFLVERIRKCECHDLITDDVGPVFQVFVDDCQDAPLFFGEYFAQLESKSNILSDGRLLLHNEDRTFLDTITRF